MRIIKFQFLYKGLPFTSTDSGFNWHKKVYHLDELINRTLSSLSDVHDTSELVAKRQFTGLTDKNGVDIYEGDVLAFAIGFKMQRGVIIFHKGAFRFDINKPFFATRTIANDAINRKASKARVIGNIYQNPELLK